MNHRNFSARTLRRVPTAVLLALLVACGGDEKGADTAPAGKSARTEQGAGSAAQAEAAQGEQLLANAVVTGKAYAPVDLKYDVLAKPVAGEPFEVDLTWLPRAPADALESEVAGMPGLEVLEGATGRIEGVQVRSRHVMKLRVRAGQPGLYFLGVTVRMVTRVQTEERQFSVPVVVMGPPGSSGAAPAGGASGQPGESAAAAAGSGSAGQPQ